MFIRTKNRINSKNEKIKYGYLVKNVWKGKPKQKVVKYLGKIVEEKPDIQLNSKVSLAKTWKNTVRQLIKQELINSNFDEKEKNVFCKNEVNVNLKSNQVFVNNKKGVIEINEGFLCNYTINKCMNMNTEDLKKFTNILLLTGILPNQELLVKIYQIYKKRKLS